MSAGGDKHPVTGNGSPASPNPRPRGKASGVGAKPPITGSTDPRVPISVARSGAVRRIQLRRAKSDAKRDTGPRGDAHPRPQATSANVPETGRVVSATPVVTPNGSTTAVGAVPSQPAPTFADVARAAGVAPQRGTRDPAPRAGTTITSDTLSLVRSNPPIGGGRKRPPKSARSSVSSMQSSVSSVPRPTYWETKRRFEPPISDSDLQTILSTGASTFASQDLLFAEMRRYHLQYVTFLRKNDVAGISALNASMWAQIAIPEDVVVADPTTVLRDAYRYLVFPLPSSYNDRGGITSFTLRALTSPTEWVDRLSISEEEKGLWSWDGTVPLVYEIGAGIRGASVLRSAGRLAYEAERDMYAFYNDLTQEWSWDSAQMQSEAEALRWMADVTRSRGGVPIPTWWLNEHVSEASKEPGYTSTDAKLLKIRESARAPAWTSCSCDIASCPHVPSSTDGLPRFVAIDTLSYLSEDAIGALPDECVVFAVEYNYPFERIRRGDLAWGDSLLSINDNVLTIRASGGFLARSYVRELNRKTTMYAGRACAVYPVKTFTTGAMPHTISATLFAVHFRPAPAEPAPLGQAGDAIHVAVRQLSSTLVTANDLDSRTTIDAVVATQRARGHDVTAVVLDRAMARRREIQDDVFDVLAMESRRHTDAKLSTFRDSFVVWAFVALCRAAGEKADPDYVRYANGGLSRKNISNLRDRCNSLMGSTVKSLGATAMVGLATIAMGGCGFERIRFALATVFEVFVISTGVRAGLTYAYRRVWDIQSSYHDRKPLVGRIT